VAARSMVAVSVGRDVDGPRYPRKGSVSRREMGTPQASSGAARSFIVSCQVDATLTLHGLKDELAACEA